MSDDDAHLTRLFAEEPPHSADEAFVARVSAAIQWQKRLLFAMPVAALALVALAIWATWPAAYAFSGDALDGIRLIIGGTGAFFETQLGMMVALVLLATAAFWAWLFNRTRGLLS